MTLRSYKIANSCQSKHSSESLKVFFVMKPLNSHTLKNLLY